MQRHTLALEHQSEGTSTKICEAVCRLLNKIRNAVGALCTHVHIRQNRTHRILGSCDSSVFASACSRPPHNLSAACPPFARSPVRLPVLLHVRPPPHIPHTRKATTRQDRARPGNYGQGQHGRDPTVEEQTCLDKTKTNQTRSERTETDQASPA